MATINQFTIGQGAEVISHTIKQQGYGRQSLFVNVVMEDGEIINDVYALDVYPNVEEHYHRRFASRDSVFLNQQELYQCNNSDLVYTEDEIYDSIPELLNKALNGITLELSE